MKFLLCALAVASFAGCSLAGSVDKAKADVTKDFLDPSAAQFRKVHTEGEYVCGEVNGKNAYGAYVGFRKFYWQAGRGSTIEPAGDPKLALTVRWLYYVKCTPQSERLKDPEKGVRIINGTEEE